MVTKRIGLAFACAAVVAVSSSAQMPARGTNC
jgi:hypothetical protein